MWLLRLKSSWQTQVAAPRVAPSRTTLVPQQEPRAQGAAWPSEAALTACTHLFSTSNVVVTVAVTVVGAVAGLMRHTSPNTPKRSATSTCKDMALHEHGRWFFQPLRDLHMTTGTGSRLAMDMGSRVSLSCCWLL